MNRREFCRHLAAVGGAALLSSCRFLPKGEINGPATTTAIPPATATRYPLPAATEAATATPAAVGQSTADPTATTQATATNMPLAEPGQAQIALVRTTDRAHGVQRAIELLGINPVRGNQVLFKPNLNSADPPPGSTHPDVMRAILVALNDMGAQAVTLGERSGMGSTRQVMQHTGVFNLADELGFATVVFDELAEQDWIIHRAADHHWSAGFPVPKLLLDTESIVQTCNLKTHRYGGHFTLSLKNSVGFAAKRITNNGYNYMTELHNSAYQRHMIAEINTVYKPALIIMDGVEAFLNGGPANGQKAETGVVLAGTDPIAMDAVGVAILRMFGTTAAVSQGKIFDQAQIARAVELELGVRSPDKIQLITGDQESLNFAAFVQEMLLAA